jgi:hypothetical protein
LGTITTLEWSRLAIVGFSIINFSLTGVYLGYRWVGSLMEQLCLDFINVRVLLITVSRDEEVASIPKAYLRLGADERDSLRRT